MTRRAAGSDAREGRLPAYVLLGAATLLVLAAARRYLVPDAPLGADASSHLTMIGSLADRIRSGQGWWCPEFNAGFPLALYYQPVPHVASALICAALGGSAHAIGVYKLLATLMVLLQPWAIYAGARRMGASRTTAAFAGASAPLVLESLGFGYTSLASLSIGLYTQSWGNVALPLALGELRALATPRRRWPAAILATALVPGCHVFYAIAIVPPILALTLLRPERLRNLGRLALAGGAAAVMLLPWLVPLMLNRSFFGAWPFESEQRILGYGFGPVLGSVARGHLLDGSALPLLTALGVAGIVRAALAFRRDPFCALVLCLAVWSLAGAIGAAGFGRLAYLYPLHQGLQLFRYSALLQFAFLLAAGLGASWVAGLVDARRRGWGIAVVAVVWLLRVPAGWAQLVESFQVLPDSRRLDTGAYAEAVRWLQGAPHGGRLYVGEATGLPGHYHISLLAQLAHRPVGFSPGGLHESYNFYALEYVAPDLPNFEALADLFDFRLLLGRYDPRIVPPGRLLARNGTYVFTELPGTHQCVAIQRAGGQVRGTPRGVRPDIRRWMAGNGPATGTTILLDVTTPRSGDDLVFAPREVPGRTDFAFAAPPRGDILRSEAEGGTFSAAVRLDEPALVTAKVTYHPFWRVTVDGKERPVRFAFPGFVAIELPPGTHEIRGSFRWPGYVRWLLLLAACPLPAAILLSRRPRA